MTAASAHKTRKHSPLHGVKPWKNRRPQDGAHSPEPRLDFEFARVLQPSRQLLRTAQAVIQWIETGNTEFG
jgi:hypothetical protein